MQKAQKFITFVFQNLKTTFLLPGVLKLVQSTLLVMKLLVMESLSGPEKNTFKLKEIDSLCYGSS
jgi:hypothetical protein